MPYNPGVSYNGDRYIFEAIQQGGSRLRDFAVGASKPTEGKGRMASGMDSMMQGGGNYLSQLKDKEEQDKQAGRKTKSLRTALASYMPESKHRLDAMGLEELEGEIQGIALQKAKAELGRFAQQDQQQQQQQQSNADLGKFAQLASQPIPAGHVNYGDESPMAKFGYAASLYPGALASRNAPQVLGALGKFAGEVQADHQPKTVSLDGVNVVYSPKGGQFQVVPPNGESPPDRQPVQDANGNVIGYNQFDGKKWNFTKAAPAPALTPATDASGKPLANVYFDQSGKLHDLRSRVDKELGDDSGGAGGGSGDELQMAHAALAKGVSRDKVAALYKQRTGKDLPK